MPPLTTRTRTRMHTAHVPSSMQLSSVPSTCTRESTQAVLYSTATVYDSKAVGPGREGLDIAIAYDVPCKHLPPTALRG